MRTCTHLWFTWCTKVGGEFLRALCCLILLVSLLLIQRCSACKLSTLLLPVDASGGVVGVDAVVGVACFCCCCTAVPGTKLLKNAKSWPQVTGDINTKCNEHALYERDR